MIMVRFHQNIIALYTINPFISIYYHIIQNINTGRMKKTEIQYIIDKKELNKGACYLVKWKNFNHFQNQWVSRAQINRIGQSTLLEQFLKEIKDRQSESIQSQKKNNKKNRAKTNKKMYKRIIKMSNPKINIPIRRKVEPHWMFGDHIIHVLDRNDQRQEYQVEWKNSQKTWVPQKQLFMYDPKQACLFFEKKLSINVRAETRPQQKSNKNDELSHQRKP